MADMCLRMMATTLFSCFALCALDGSTFVWAGPPATLVTVETIAANPADVTTLDGIIKAFYEVISGPPGQPRQWARDRTLYIPGVRFVEIMKKPNESEPRALILDHQQYVESSNESMVRKGFFEREIHRVTKTYGYMTHVYSTYEKRSSENGPASARGINSIELFNDGKRWWIASVQWESERSDYKIPAELAP